jgi:hypothetical protein
MKDFNVYTNNETEKDLKLSPDSSNDENSSWKCPVYNRKIAELIEKICDESTTMCALESGDIMAIKTKTIICPYIWDPQRKKIISQKSKISKKRYENFGEVDFLRKNFFNKEDNEIDTCPLYNQSLSNLLETLMDEATTIGILKNGIIIAIKVKSIIVNYKWEESLKEFVSQKVRVNRNNKIKKKMDFNDFDPEEVDHNEFIDQYV